MKFNKIFFILQIGIVSSVLLGCKENKIVEEDKGYTLDVYNFKPLYYNSGSYTFDKYLDSYPEMCKIVTYRINKDIGTDNYIKIEVETDCDLCGWITYHDTKDSSKVNTEKFFIRKGETEFKTFLDSFRSGAFGKFETKTIDTIAFQGVDSEKNGCMVFKSLSCSDREYSNQKMFIDDGTIKLGTSVNYGGSIEWLERIDINIIEYIDNGGNVRIDKDMDRSMVNENRLISENVNLVNTFDLGREVQPSYYLRVDKEHNGYNPLTPYKYESLSGSAEYNPIQCGGVGDIENNIITEPQVIDYEYKADHIYIKTKGQDWMFVNDQAQGYIESNYHFGEDGLLIVDNSYVDFYQFKNLNPQNNPYTGQETPATYFSYPLNYFYCQTKTRTIYDPYIGEVGSGHTPIEDPSTTIPGVGQYYYAIRSSFMKNNCDWVANVNDKKFGVGIYMPNADYYIASRGITSCSYSAPQNSGYTKRFYDFGDGFTPSYAASNYNYINPQLRRRMVEFIPLEYQYAIYIGDVSEMNDAFDNAKRDGLTNDNLTMSEGTWPKR